MKVFKLGNIANRSFCERNFNARQVDPLKIIGHLIRICNRISTAPIFGGDSGIKFTEGRKSSAHVTTQTPVTGQY